MLQSFGGMEKSMFGGLRMTSWREFSKRQSEFNNFLREQIVEKNKRILELRETLEFYANEQNYDSRHGMAILKDCGDKAREGLK